MSAEALLGGAILGGGLINSAGQLYGAKKQRDWEADMANTAHQREVNDLLKAGLNPILSATGGRGAATPQIEAVNPAAGLGESLQNAARAVALDAGRLQNETALTEANSAKAKADTRLTDANTLLTLQGVSRGDLVRQKLEADIANVGQSTKTSSAQEAATRAGIPLTEAQTGLARANTTKAEAEAAVLKSIAPFLTRGLDAITQLVDYASTGGKLGDAAYDLVQAAKNSGYLQTLGPWGTADLMSGKALMGAAKSLVELIKKYAPQVLDNLKGGAGNSSAQDILDNGGPYP